MAETVEYCLLSGNKKIINMVMIKNFLIISCTGKNDKIGLKVNNSFFMHNFQTKIQNNDKLVDTIYNFTKKHEVQLNKDFSILVNYGPGSFSSVRAALTVAKGIKVATNVKLFGFKNSDLPRFSLENIEILINKDLLEKNLIKPLYLS